MFNRIKKYVKHLSVLAVIVATFVVVMPHFNIGEVSPISNTYSVSTCDGMWTEHARFSLTGGHAQGKCSCASCHSGGFYAGSAPNSCIGCHMGGRPAAMQKPIGHINTGSIDCASCHTTISFVNYTMNHTAVASSTCSSCHGVNVFAKGKSSDHVPTQLDCVTCHTTKSWDTTFDHVKAGVVAGTCNDCHMTGKGGAKRVVSNHIPTTESCDGCHNGYNTFANGLLNHAGPTASATTCEACHTGAKLGATMRGPQHIANVQNCAACHNSTGWTCVSAKLDVWMTNQIQQAKLVIKHWFA